VNPVSFGTQINHQLNVPAPGALKTDLGLDPTQATLNSPSAQGGTVVDNGNGAFLYTPPTGFSGTDSFTYDAWDYDTDVDYTGTVTIYVDGTPPTVSMSAPPTVTEGTRVTATWAGADDQGVASYDVQYQIAPWNGPFGPWTWFRQAVPASQHTGTLVENYGRTVCFRARARDFAGNVSPFVTRCTATALRATSLGYSPLWTRLTSSAFFGRYAERTVYKGQSALLNSVQAKHLWLVATRCPSCGTVTVRWKGVGIKAINLAYPATQHNVLFPIASFAAPQAGPVQVIVTSPSGRQVVIQGLAVSRV
jgi:hypothetical protein